jgi:hypothetical protein
MAQESKILEDALKATIGENNLPSWCPDFKTLTRELLRKIEHRLVLVDRKSWTEMGKPMAGGSLESLRESTESFRKHIDECEKRNADRGSIPPAILKIADK